MGILLMGDTINGGEAQGSGDRVNEIRRKVGIELDHVISLSISFKMNS